MKNHANASAKPPLRGSTASRSQSRIPPSSSGSHQLTDPEAILQEGRKKSRAAAKGLSEDNRKVDPDLTDNLDAYSFSAIDSVIAERSTSTPIAVQNPPVHPAIPLSCSPHSNTIIPLPLLSQDTSVIRSLAPLSASLHHHTHSSHLDTAVDAETPQPTTPINILHSDTTTLIAESSSRTRERSIDTVERVPSPFLRATDTRLSTDPPALTNRSASLAFPSMNTSNVQGSGGALTPSIPNPGSDRIARLEAMVEALTSS